jgi:hypothetical protein
LTHPHLFKTFAHYGVTLPAAPSVVDYFTGVKALADILGNDELGDCTAAGACHIVEAVTAAAGAGVTLERADAVAFYTQSTGYVVGDPSTDQGGDEITVLTSWRDVGVKGHKISGWLSVDPKNEALIRSVLATFGPVLYFGVELPDSYMDLAQGGAGFTWGTGTPDQNNGHCFVGVGANDSGVQIDTWGLVPDTITYAAVAELCSDANGGNLFAVLSPEVINAAKCTAPDGLAWAALEADFAALGGST